MRRRITIQDLDRAVQRLETVMANTQAENQALIDAVTSQLVTITGKLNTAQQDIALLKQASAGQTLDFAPVNAAATALDQQADAVVADVTPPAPAG